MDITQKKSKPTLFEQLPWSPSLFVVGLIMLALPNNFVAAYMMLAGRGGAGLAIGLSILTAESALVAVWLSLGRQSSFWRILYTVSTVVVLSLPVLLAARMLQASSRMSVASEGILLVLAMIFIQSLPLLALRWAGWTIGVHQPVFEHRRHRFSILQLFMATNIGACYLVMINGLWPILSESALSIIDSNTIAETLPLLIFEVIVLWLILAVLFGRRFRWLTIPSLILATLFGPATLKTLLSADPLSSNGVPGNSIGLFVFCLFVLLTLNLFYQGGHQLRRAKRNSDRT